MSKILILFYSFEGNTRRVSKLLSDKLNIPYKEIKPVKDLKSKGFSKYIWGGSQVVMKKKPELMEVDINLDDYDTIILGTPIWAGTFAPAIKTLLEDKLKNKKIAFFYCHDGGPGKSEKKAKEAININNTFVSSIGLERVRYNFEDIKGDVLSWAQNMLE